MFAKPATPCDQARDFLTKAGLSYQVRPAQAGAEVVTTIAGRRLEGFDGEAYRVALEAAGYPAAADPARVNRVATVALLTLLMIYVTMVYGPIAAFLVELFPTRIRYSSMSLPYHIGNGWFGGFLPTAWSLEVGGITKRIAGVILLDAVYGELDKFATWIENNRGGFFVSSYTRYTRKRSLELMAMLREKGIASREEMDGPLRPGSVVFVQTPNGITHRSYVTQAWTEHPVKDVLVKMAAPPTRMAAAPQPAGASR